MKSRKQILFTAVLLFNEVVLPSICLKFRCLSFIPRFLKVRAVAVYMRTMFIKTKLLLKLSLLSYLLNSSQVSMPNSKITFFVRTSIQIFASPKKTGLICPLYMQTEPFELLKVHVPFLRGKLLDRDQNTFSSVASVVM